MPKVEQFEGLPLVPPIGLNINYQHNFPTAIHTLYELFRKTKDEKHKATYLNDAFQRNGKFTSAYKYLCDYFGIAFRCSVEGISELLKKLTNKKIQETLKQENVENIAEIVESCKELIKLIIKAKENNNNPTIKEIEQNPHLISTLDIKTSTLTNEEKIYLLNSYYEYFSPKEISYIMGTFSLKELKRIDASVWNILSKESPEEAMNFLKNKTKEIFINLSNNSNLPKNCIDGGFGEAIREIMYTLSFEELKKINANVWNTLFEKNPEEAMNFLNNSRYKAEVFIHLSRNSYFIKILIERGLGKGIREIMDTLSFEKIEQISSNVLNIFSKENPEEAMNFLNKRKKDQKKVFIYLSWLSDFIENCIEGGFVEGIREIMGTFSLKELKRIHENVWNILSKESPEAVMKFLNNREEDKKEVFISLSQEIDLIEIFIYYGSGKEIRDIIFELNLQNDPSFEDFMNKLKEKHLVQKTGFVFINRKWEKI